MTVSEVNKEPDYWPRYSKVEHERLKHQFPGSGGVKFNWSLVKVEFLSSIASELETIMDILPYCWLFV